MEPEPERGREPVTAEAVLRELRLFELRCQGEEVPDKREGSAGRGLEGEMGGLGKEEGSVAGLGVKVWGVSGVVGH